jgi:hypothetical protein
MGMDMSAYVYVGKTDDGHDRYDFAPLEHFNNVSIVGRASYETPTFRLSMDIQKILHDALKVKFEVAYISFTPEEAELSIPKLQAQSEIYLKKREIENYIICLGVMQFFRVCVKRNYNISALKKGGECDGENR